MSIIEIDAPAVAPAATDAATPAVASAPAVTTLTERTARVLEQMLAVMDWTLVDFARHELSAGEAIGGRVREVPFFLVMSGELELRTDGETTRLRGGDFVLRTRPTGYRVRADGDAVFIAGSLRLAGSGEHPLVRSLPEALIACQLLRRDAHLNALAEALVAEVASARPASCAFAGRLVSVLAASAVRAWVENGCAPDGWLLPASDPHIARAVDAILGDPGGAWTLERLARVATTSRSAFAERFHSVVGEPPARYLLRVRMERAKILLADDRASVAQTASSLGYGSEAAFSRAFRRHTGSNPSAWRKASAVA
ncbi:helix-turn-helix transcriptional regulator [Leifsonia aquatica]|uniref:helix-turn-helix transcriptional regulator n=1 Tax=Leifsonia aquatica TaxID=144185 RepID=UPI000469CA02|nr:AraC family transcriptional regulator [Leifsonia aquatica]